LPPAKPGAGTSGRMPSSTATQDRTAPTVPQAHTAPMDDDGAAPLLDRRRERFAQLVAQAFSQADAYRQVWQPVDAKAESVLTLASRIASAVDVRSRIDYLRHNLSAQDAAAFAVTRVRLLAEVARLAMYDVRESIGPDGKPLPLKDLPDTIAAAVEGVDILTGPDGTPTAWRYKFAPKARATDQLAKILGMYAADNRQRADSLADALARLADQTGAAPSLAARLTMADDAAQAGQEPAGGAASPPDDSQAV
jgi:hypothetical protein